MRELLRPRLAPFLAAWYLGLVLVAEGGAVRERLPDLIGTLTFATLTAASMWVVACLMARNRNRRAIVATILVLWVELFGNARILLQPTLGHLSRSPMAVLLIWTMAFAVILAFARWAPAARDGLVRGLTAALTLLILMASIPMALALRPPPRLEVVPGPKLPDQRSIERPDIYIILLDKFASLGTMRKWYGLDLSSFRDSLRAMGFVLPERARSNYIHTQLVISTMLNWRLVRDELAAAPEGPWIHTQSLIEDAPIWAFLHQRGYRFAFFPTGFPGTHSNRHADILLPAPEARYVRFGQTWILNTPIDLVLPRKCHGMACGVGSDFPYPVERADAMRWKLETLATLPDSSGPIVAFLHFLGSHEPYIFERDCRSREPWWPLSDMDADSARAREAYAAQIACVSHLILNTVRTLIAHSRIPPVIVLQSDHGNGRISVDPVRGITLPLETVTPAQINERLDVFAAYRFPGADRVVYDSITPVNVLPVLFNSLFHAGIPLSPDRSFWSTFRDPTAVTEVFRTPGDSRH